MIRKRKEKSAAAKPAKNRLEKLQAAIQDLEHFADLNEDAPIPSVQNLEVEDDHLVAKPRSPIEQTIQLTRYFIDSIFSDHPRQEERKAQVQQKLLESIQFLKTHYRIIQKLKHGTQAEQEVADWALKAINRYNAIIKKAKEEPRSLRERAARFLYKKSGVAIDDELQRNTIFIPQEHVVRLESAESPSTTEKITALLPQMRETGKQLKPTQPEIDLLRMKSLSLAKKTGKFPQSLQKTLNSMIWSAPIIATPVSEETVSVEQTFKALPGEVIKVKGEFKRDAKSPVPSVPIPESFHMSTQAIQTGFPDPLQHTGMALTEHLIPALPLRMDFLEYFQHFYHLMQQIAHELLPEGALNQRAKQSFKLRYDAFAQFRAELLPLHKTLLFAIAKAANHPDISGDKYGKVFNQFLSELEQADNPLEKLAAEHDKINTIFIKAPFDRLHEEFLSEHHPQHAVREPRQVLQLCQTLMDEAIQHAIEQQGPLSEYAAVMGALLKDASKAIILQQLSEKIGFPPPLLNNFEQKVQTWAYMQVFGFHHELIETPFETPEQMSEFLKGVLLLEISLFKGESFELLDHPAVTLVQELELYYNSQYYQG
jgi:hypothetical protein